MASAGVANEQQTITIASIYVCVIKRGGAGLHFGHIKICLILYYFITVGTKGRSAEDRDGWKF